MDKKYINVALQGGGSHGAFTWGVLDRLLEDDRLQIEGVSGTSAGAMNAAILVNGFAQGGSQGAKEALHTFWREISQLGMVYNPLKQSSLEISNGEWNLDWSLSYNFASLLSRLTSPYQTNPLNLNPLRWVLEKTLDLKVLQSCEQLELFITATNVRTGQPRIFKEHEITIDVLLASACIPFIFQAIEIQGETYWDGGYMGNPAIWPLIYQTKTSDVILIQVNPIYRDDIPDTSHEIINRLNEITFNSSLIAEMRAIEFVCRLINAGVLKETHYKNLKIHLIKDVKAMSDLNASSKMNTSWKFFTHLRTIGYNAAHRWLEENFDSIGKQSTVDIKKEFLRK